MQLIYNKRQGIQIPARERPFWRDWEASRRTERTKSCFCVTSRATYWAKSNPPNPPPPPLCRHLDSIGFSRAGKSNACFKTNCFLLDQLSLPLMCNSFTPSWPRSARRGTLGTLCQKACCSAFLPRPAENELCFDWRTNYKWLCGCMFQPWTLDSFWKQLQLNLNSTRCLHYLYFIAKVEMTFYVYFLIMFFLFFVKIHKAQTLSRKV